MFAVIRTGGKQYKVETGTIIEVEKLVGEVGAAIQLDDVLLCGSEGSVKIGTPVVAGARVHAEIIEQKRGEKLIIFKKLRRQGKKLKKGHRQALTRLKVKEITFKESSVN